MLTPYYLFRSEDFYKRLKLIKNALPETELTFSIKANPFLLNVLPGNDLIKHVEVCSPGELEICRERGIEGGRIIYSGVMKEETDVHEAVSYGAAFVTAESKRHFELISDEAGKSGKEVNVLLRLTSGNQFGMSWEDALEIIAGSHDNGVRIFGIHYYSGTAKNKLKQIEKDLSFLSEFIERAGKEQDFRPELVEYGPGLSAEYYTEPYEDKDEELLREVSEVIRDFSRRYRTGIEMGRFMAAPCGYYHTRVKDIKENHGVTYVIVDGGIHQLKYYGQNMAMKVPPLSVIRDGEEYKALNGETKDYCICGSLCTVADVLVRNVSLPELRCGDILKFGRTGAYSVSEGALSFLSRDLPEIWLDDGDMKCLRQKRPSWTLNCGGE